MIFHKRKARWGRMVAIILVVVLIGGTGRMLWANGFMTSVHTGFRGACRVVAHLPGVADIEIADNIAFISAASARGPGPQDGIYALPLKDGGKLIRLKGAPRDFHPRGIGLYHGAGGRGLYLVAVNKLTVGKASNTPAYTDHFSIDSFEVADPAGTPALVAQGTIRGGLLTDPRDVAASGPGTFYVANGATATNPLVRWLQANGVIAGSNILYFNGMAFKVAVDGLYGARSLVLADKGHHLVVAATLSRNLTSFQREPFTGTLTETDDSLSLPAGPQMLSLDGQGNVLVAGIANLWNAHRYAADPSRPVPSQVFRAALNGGVPASYDQVFGDDGRKIGAAGVAAFGAGHLLIGSALDGRLLECNPKNAERV